MGLQPLDNSRGNNRTQSDSAGRDDPLGWVLPVIDILKQNTREKNIDFSMVEAALGKLPLSDYLPEYDSRVRRTLEAVGIYSVPRSGDSTGPYSFDAPVDLENRVIDTHRELEAFLTESTPKIFSEIFSRPLCARMLGPSLISPLLFSRGIQDSCEIDPKILQIFANHLTPEAYQGFGRELVRHLFGNLISHQQNQQFDRYAEVILKQDTHVRTRIDFAGETSHSLLVADMQCSVYNMLRLSNPPPSWMATLIGEAGGVEFFKPFDAQELTEWFENGFAALTRQYRRSLEVFQAHRHSDAEEDQRLLERHENIVQASQDRLSNYLDMILLAHAKFDAFHQLHQDKFDELDPLSDDVLEELGNPESTTPPQGSSKLPLMLAECTSAMLNVLGYGDSFSVPLDPIIPARIAETREFGWYLDEHKENIQTHIDSCFLRFIKNHDFRSANSLIIILPTSTSEFGALSIAQEFKDLIERRQDTICKAVIDSINLVADWVTSYVLNEEPDPFFPDATRNLRRGLYESEFEDLKAAIPFLLSSQNRRGEGNPELYGALVRLVSNFLCTEPLTEEGHEAKTNHRGFELSLNLLETLGPEGRHFAGRILTGIFENYSEHQREFAKYLRACDRLAGQLMAIVDLNGEMKNTDAAQSVDLDPREMALYERRINTAVTLHKMLPMSGKKLFWPPENCIAFISKMARGREIRQIIESQSGDHSAQAKFALNDVRRTQLSHSHRPADEPYSHHQANLARSVIELYKHGVINDSRETRETLAETVVVLGRARLSELQCPFEYHSPETLKASIFHIESYFLAGFRFSLQGSSAETIVRHARNLHDLYDWACQRRELADDDKNAYRRLSVQFDHLCSRIEQILSTIDPAESRIEINTLLRDFLESHDISRLVTDSYIA